MGKVIDFMYLSESGHDETRSVRESHIPSVVPYRPLRANDTTKPEAASAGECGNPKRLRGYPLREEPLPAA